MNQFLDNPVFHALSSGDAEKAMGSAQVKYFDSAVSPFAGFADGYDRGFKELHEDLPRGRRILIACRDEIKVHYGFRLIKSIEGSQFLYLSKTKLGDDFSSLVPLNEQHVDQMINLAKITQPGPFGRRTIEFGNYHGIFVGNELVAMTGRRLHVYGYTEVSAVCTHPDHNGKGYARKLLRHQVNSILEEGRVPFLHVRSDNQRAIDLYERMGFALNGVMNFYFMVAE